MVRKGDGVESRIMDETVELNGRYCVLFLVMTRVVQARNWNLKAAKKVQK